MTTEYKLPETPLPVAWLHELMRSFKQSQAAVQQRIDELEKQQHQADSSEHERGLIDGQIKALQWVLTSPFVNISCSGFWYQTSDPHHEGWFWRDGDISRISEG